MSWMSRTWTGMSWSRRVSLTRGFEREGGRAWVSGERKLGVVREVERRRWRVVARREGRDGREERCVVEGVRMGARKAGLGRGRCEVERERRSCLCRVERVGVVIFFGFGERGEVA